MHQQIIPDNLLQSSDKVLFIAHLALGDFTYLQTQFRAFAEAYPHLKIDLWIDEVRRTNDQAQWPFLRNYSLYDWAESCTFFHKVYRQTYSHDLYRASIEQARAEQYPIVISLATLRPHQYASLAREIAPNGFVVGMRRPTGLFKLHHALAYRKLDAAIPPYRHQEMAPFHISDEYAFWFALLGGTDVPREQRHPFVTIPAQWHRYAEDQLAQWGFGLQAEDRIVFINAYAKTKKRCWPLDHVASLITRMQQHPQWQHACFIVNAVPQELAHARQVIEAHGLSRTVLFSAEENFFQLPAILAKCDLIISVETAVMHLANAVHVPVIALMRQKNPEWVPFDSNNSLVLCTANRRQWVRDIPVDNVLNALDKLPAAIPWRTIRG